MYCTLPETNGKHTWKWMVGRLLSFWEFSGAMLVSGSVPHFDGIEQEKDHDPRDCYLLNGFRKHGNLLLAKRSEDFCWMKSNECFQWVLLGWSMMDDGWWWSMMVDDDHWRRRRRRRKKHEKKTKIKEESYEGDEEQTSVRWVYQRKIWWLTHKWYTAFLFEEINRHFWKSLLSTNNFSRWWFQIFFIFTPNLGEIFSNLTCAYFSNGLVQPPYNNIIPI